MKKKENIEKNEDLPIATMVLKDYKKTVQDYKEYNKTLTENNERIAVINKRLTIIIVVLIVLLAIACTYIILTWEICNPDLGLFKT